MLLRKPRSPRLFFPQCIPSSLSVFLVLSACSLAAVPGASAQTAEPRPAELTSQSAPVASGLVAATEPRAVDAVLDLPDAPGYSSVLPSESVSGADGVSSSLEPGASTAGAAGALAFGGRPRTPGSSGPYDKVVLPGQTAARLTVHDKVILGVRENLSAFAAAGWLISAGYEQATNGSPNYGQTGKGFAQRLGAAAARSSSENIFQDSVLASVLHEDPRYYKLGSGHNLITRLFYAGTRPIIGKTDGGRRTINFADLGGDLAGAALTPAYYPPLNRGFDEVLKTFGGSVGGDALGYVVSEFLSTSLHGLRGGGQKL